MEEPEDIYLKVVSPFLKGNQGEPAYVVVDIGEWARQTDDVWRRIADQLNLIHDTDICEPEMIKKQFYDGEISMDAREIGSGKAETNVVVEEPMQEGPSYESPEDVYTSWGGVRK
jgi:hypothetical protein